MFSLNTMHEVDLKLKEALNPWCYLTTESHYLATNIRFRLIGKQMGPVVLLPRLKSQHLSNIKVINTKITWFSSDIRYMHSTDNGSPHVVGKTTDLKLLSDAISARQSALEAFYDDGTGTKTYEEAGSEQPIIGGCL